MHLPPAFHRQAGLLQGSYIKAIEHGVPQQAKLWHIERGCEEAPQRPRRRLQHRRLLCTVPLHEANKVSEGARWNVWERSIRESQHRADESSRLGEGLLELSK